jgi:hypothetical protein
MMTTFVWVVLWSASIAGLQTPSARAGGVVVAGTVVDERTGQPLERVSIRLADSGQAAVSDTRGRFEIAGENPYAYEDPEHLLLRQIGITDEPAIKPLRTAGHRRHRGRSQPPGTGFSGHQSPVPMPQGCAEALRQLFQFPVHNTLRCSACCIAC